MAVLDPNRAAVYTIGGLKVGGLAPYGFVNTPGFIAGNVPAALPGAEDQNVLYERQGWGDPAQVVQTAQGYTNPPFLGVGSTSQAMAPWMDQKNGAGRILRGYMRRDRIYPLSDPNTTPDLARSNARLFFMFNPDHIQRSYQSYDQAAQTLYPSNDPSSLPAFSQLITQFSLFFDRQEEVAVYYNHPGCLIDLAVFDLLGGMPSGQVSTSSSAGTTDSSGATVSAGLDAGLPAPTDTTSLQLDPGNMIVVVFSPNLSYRGTIMTADAMFEKFSHRMTPTRMELSITMRLYGIGQEPAIVKGSGADIANAAAVQKSLANVVPHVEQTQAAADAVNAAGREMAMAWCEKWLPGGPVAGGVPYSNLGTERLMYMDRDDLLLDDPHTTQDASGNWTDGHQPRYFDCSSYVVRGLKVIAWLEALNLGGDANSYAIRDAAKAGNGHTWLWAPFGIIGFADKMWVPGAILGRDSGAGHAAWLRAVDGDKYTILEQGGPKSHVDPPKKWTTTKDWIIAHYDWIAVPQTTVVAGK